MPAEAYVEFDALTFKDGRNLRTRGTGILNQENHPRKWKVRIQATRNVKNEDGLFPCVTTWIKPEEPVPLRALYGHILENIKEQDMEYSDYSSIMVRIMRQ